jgi:hypothetical protein
MSCRQGVVETLRDVQAPGVSSTEPAPRRGGRRILDEGATGKDDAGFPGMVRRWLLVSMGFVFGVMTPVGAVVPGGNGAIAFTSGNSDIAVLDPCGATRSLLAGPAADLRPV